MTLYCWSVSQFCGLGWLRRWLRRPKSEAQILSHWGQAGPAGVAWEAACLRALWSLATCSDAAQRFFSLVAHVELRDSLSAARLSRLDSGILCNNNNNNNNNSNESIVLTLCQPFIGHLRLFMMYPTNLGGASTSNCWPLFSPSKISHSSLTGLRLDRRPWCRVVTPWVACVNIDFNLNWTMGFNLVSK